MEGQYNMRSPAVKRLMKEAAELREPNQLYHAQPLEDNLFEWHFTVRGPPDTEFEGGIYHGRIVLPPEYPMKPPTIMLYTPNGRFELNKKICLSISGHHPESWQPSWSIRTALLAIIGFMPTPGAGAIGSLDYPPEERKKLAKRSQDWRCSTCNIKLSEVLPEVTESSREAAHEAQELAQKIVLKGEDKKEEKETTEAGNGDGNPETQPEAKPAAAEPAASTETAGPSTSSQPNTETKTTGKDSELRQRKLPEPLSPIPTIGSATTGLTSPPVTSSATQPSTSSFVTSTPIVDTRPRPAPIIVDGGRQNTAFDAMNWRLLQFVVFCIVFLIARRVYLSNEWRFHTPRGGE